MDYLGNKTGLAPDIVRVFERLVAPRARVADVFAGTGSVSAALADAGFDIDASDQLPLSVTWTRARLLGASATFESLVPELGPLDHRPLETVVDHLNQLTPETGWVTRSYSPASIAQVGVERRYLTEENARRIDAVRHQLRAWSPLLDETERAVLLTCLVEAVSAVSNIAGTYGCYLKSWKPSSLRPFALVPFTEFARVGEHRIVRGDADTLAAETAADALYADPPYTKRQYAAYYHLLNSIVTDDEPALTGSTGLPDWKPLASDWCYKQRAPQALERLAAKCAAPVLALSYSSDGHVADDVIRDLLGVHGRVEVHEFERRRYRSSNLPHKAATVMERLYVMQR